jgi:hypothetical protein
MFLFCPDVAFFGRDGGREMTIEKLKEKSETDSQSELF